MMNFTYDKLDQDEVLEVIFHPRTSTPVPSSPDVIEKFIEVAPGISIEARFHLSAPDAPHILFFHGNGEIAADYDDIAGYYLKQGFSFIAVDYRGYGKSQGSPTASTMISDSHTTYSYVRNWMVEEARTGPFIVMGRSLGSACAIDLAYTFQSEITALFIDSGFAQTLPLLIKMGVDINKLGITEQDGFKNVRKISRISKPTLFFHGQHDQIIPAVSAEILQAECQAKNKQFQLIPGADHNNIFEKVGEMYFEVIRQFMNKVLKIRPKRYQSRRKKKQ